MFSKLFSRGRESKKMSPEETSSIAANWAFLGADMHSHFLPGIDDGAKNLEEGLALVKAMANMGYKTLITTPHTMIDFYPNTTGTITEAYHVLKAAIEAEAIPIKLRAASEYYIDEHFVQLLEKEPLLTVYKNEVLVEFSMLCPPPMLNEVLFKMISSGYKPIIAHPERYAYFSHQFAKFTELRDRGCLFQLNMLSICGYYGRSIRDVAMELLRKNMYDYCGSDMHNLRHATTLHNMIGTKDYDTFVQYPFLNPRLCLEN